MVYLKTNLWMILKCRKETLVLRVNVEIIPCLSEKKQDNLSIAIIL